MKKKQHVTAFLLEVTKLFFFTSNTADELRTIKPETRLNKSELWHSYKKRQNKKEVSHTIVLML